MTSFVAGPVAMTLHVEGLGTRQNAGLADWIHRLGDASTWAAPVTVHARLDEREVVQRYRERFDTYIDFPNLRWDASERALAFDLPASFAYGSCWGLCMAHRHALMAGLVAASQGTNWRCFHGGLSVLADGRGVMVVGASGAGKSTLLRRLASDVRGDEVVAVRQVDDGLEARGTAVPGDLRCADMTPQPLAAVVVPARSDRRDVGLRRLPAAEALGVLLSAAIRITPEALREDFDWLDGVLAQVPVFELAWHLEGDLPLLSLLDALSS